MVSGKYAIGLGLAVALLVAPPRTHSQPAPKPHKISVKFDYNFAPMHACPARPSAPCIKRFDVYNLTDTGQRILLFSIPAPAGAKSAVRGIAGTSKPLVFAPGQHLIGVSAVTNRGTQSDPHACSVMVDVAP